MELRELLQRLDDRRLRLESVACAPMSQADRLIAEISASPADPI
jgi:hypothetical protein